MTGLRLMLKSRPLLRLVFCAVLCVAVATAGRDRETTLWLDGHRVARTLTLSEAAPYVFAVVAPLFVMGRMDPWERLGGRRHGHGVVALAGVAGLLVLAAAICSSVAVGSGLPPVWLGANCLTIYALALKADMVVSPLVGTLAVACAWSWAFTGSSAGNVLGKVVAFGPDTSLIHASSVVLLLCAVAGAAAHRRRLMPGALLGLRG